MQSARLRGALLGTGEISQFHMLAWQAIASVEIVALANRTREKAEEMGRRFGVTGDHIYSDYRELLARQRLDFVDIATAPDVHKEQVIAAAEAGVHVLCQKPLANSMEDALEMVEACESAGVRCFVNENWRWRRWYREVHRLLESGIVGVPRYARFQSHDDQLLPPSAGELPPVLAQQGYLADTPRLIVMDFGIHPIDTMRFLFGDVRRVYARMERSIPRVRGEDRAVLVLEFESGLTGIVDLCWTARTPEERRWVRGNVDSFVLEGDLGTIELDPYSGNHLILTTEGGTERWEAHQGLSRAEAYVESFVNAQSHFADCLLKGVPGENEARDNLKTLAVVMAAYQSAETGSPVEPAYPSSDPVA